jgi:hypothetical protein
MIVLRDAMGKWGRAGRSGFPYCATPNNVRLRDSKNRVMLAKFGGYLTLLSRAGGGMQGFI